MSAFLGEVADFVGLGPQLEALRAALGLQGLLPASFRGVPFHIEDQERLGGRRVAIHEFPLRDRLRTEDLGRARREFLVTAYVIGPDYRSARDALLSACEDLAAPGTLVLPTGYEMVVRCTTVRVVERVRNVATLLIAFVEAGSEEGGLKSQTDMLSQIRRLVGRVLRLARAGFALAYATRNLGDFITRAATSGLLSLSRDLANAWLGLPGLDLAGTARTIGLLASANPENPAEAVTAPAQALAAAAQAMPQVQTTPAEAEAETSRAAPAPSRREVVVALLAVALAPPLVPGPTLGVIAARVEANRQALDALSRDVAALMGAELLAGMVFASLEEARRLRDSILEALDARADVRAAVGDDQGFRAWRELAAVTARDMTERARRAPVLADYALPDVMPSLTLSQRLYRSGTRADDLVALNDAPHPAFMPARGKALRA